MTKKEKEQQRLENERMMYGQLGNPDPFEYTTPEKEEIANCETPHEFYKGKLKGALKLCEDCGYGYQA